MATRRRTTAARKTTGRRKTTARRRASPARRKTTTRRRKTTRRKAPARRKTTTRRRRTARRKPATTRRRRTARRKTSGRRKTTTRRRKTTRRKSPARRKTTTRRRRTARRKPTTRRRRTTRRKATGRRRRTSRRKSAGRRRSVARRKSGARRKSTGRALMSRRRAGKMSLKGFRSFVKDHLAGRALAVTAFGLMLPALGVYTASKLNLGSMVSRVPVLSTVMGNAYGRAALGATVTAGISYLAVGAGLLGRNEAIMANSIALVLLGLNAMKQSGHLPGMLAEAAPATSALESGIFGYGGSMHGYGGYLGYLGAVEEDDEPAGELFGYSAAPRVNIF
jgi:hypothetical protein